MIRHPQIRLLMLAATLIVVVFCGRDARASLMVPDSTDSHASMTASSSAPADEQAPDTLRRVPHDDTDSALGAPREHGAAPSVSCVVDHSAWVIWPRTPQRVVVPLRTLVTDPSPQGIFHPPRV